MLLEVHMPKMDLGRRAEAADRPCRVRGAPVCERDLDLRCAYKRASRLPAPRQRDADVILLDAVILPNDATASRVWCQQSSARCDGWERVFGFRGGALAGEGKVSSRLPVPGLIPVLCFIRTS